MRKFHVNEDRQSVPEYSPGFSDEGTAVLIAANTPVTIPVPAGTIKVLITGSNPYKISSQPITLPIDDTPIASTGRWGAQLVVAYDVDPVSGDRTPITNLYVVSRSDCDVQVEFFGG
ncbi:MAG: hypothetical protein ACTSR1_00300 [Candidatus Heimdallarchaeota archaeon]